MRGLFILMMTAVACLIAIDSGAANTSVHTVYIVNGQEVSKIEAMKSLMNNPEIVVQKCVAQELSDKATLRNKKK